MSSPDALRPAIYKDLDRVLLDEVTIRDRIGGLGKQIARDYQKRDLFVLGVLKGSAPFVSDLIRCVDLPLEYGFVTVSTYQGRTSSQREPLVTGDPLPDVAGKDVLVVEDILDSGKTISCVVRWAAGEAATSVRVCVLIAKEGYERSAWPAPDYLGFVVPRVFVVGYGLDYHEYYRNLRCVGVLKEEVYASRDRKAGGPPSDSEG